MTGINQKTGTGYAYDGDGNPTSYGGTALTFDPENRLTAFGTAQTDRYDGDGHRVIKNIGSTYYTFDERGPGRRDRAAGQRPALP